jgi:hypothetical protein
MDSVRKTVETTKSSGAAKVLSVALTQAAKYLSLVSTFLKGTSIAFLQLQTGCWRR